MSTHDIKSATSDVGPEYVRAIAPYQAGKPIEELAREFKLDPATIIKLASNENPLGVPASARRAMETVITGLGRYPDPNGFELKAALAKHYRVPADWITLGNGSNDLLELASLALLSPGLSCVYAQHAFVVYRLATQARGARHIMVPARDYGHDLNAMFDAIDQDTSVVFIANPNNPTGTFLPAEEVAAFLARVHEHHGDSVTVMLDEAYNEYLDASLRVDSARWVEQYSNLIVSRTFSKAYGLAGLRVGFAIAQPRLTDLLNRVRQPFNVNSLAQAAAIAALNDAAFLEQSYEVNRLGKQALTEGFARLGLEFVPSYGNFVLLRVGDAARVNLELLKRGVIVRPVAGDGLPEWLRISIGLPEENARFLQALADILGAP
ncbi:histidinol-phosphate transaminase [Pollutimonas harenae]|uniref:Histidinol-phosphate aminotransferase n=1 Tax=Pollutimonas harenae TaxID=657015 RepID=A0A853GTX8_9BURK|nr:histidinol-phosphate transaminase [Pollutimonas harenae]NYT85701.1 histidinol-phosphate transaminase [Pollutimonas harenae]TEA70773.1 histidinol-phosphate transaminase [Pollutimonas harenae]